jgi:hypothetical protein
MMIAVSRMHKTTWDFDIQFSFVTQACNSSARNAESTALELNFDARCAIRFAPKSVSLNHRFTDLNVGKLVSREHIYSIDECVIPLLSDVERFASCTNGEATFRKLDELEF